MAAEGREMSKPFFLRRDMEKSIVALVGEKNEKGEPYAAVVRIEGQHGHITVHLDERGDFVVTLHPWIPNKAVPIVGSLHPDMLGTLGIIHFLDGESMSDFDTSSKKN